MSCSLRAVSLIAIQKWRRQEKYPPGCLFITLTHNRECVYSVFPTQEAAHSLFEIGKRAFLIVSKFARSNCRVTQDGSKRCLTHISSHWSKQLPMPSPPFSISPSHSSVTVWVG